MMTDDDCEVDVVMLSVTNPQNSAKSVRNVDQLGGKAFSFRSHSLQDILEETPLSHAPELSTCPLNFGERSEDAHANENNLKFVRNLGTGTLNCHLRRLR